MARICEVCGKGPQVGNNVSHANNESKRRWLPTSVGCGPWKMAGRLLEIYSGMSPLFALRARSKTCLIHR